MPTKRYAHSMSNSGGTPQRVVFTNGVFDLLHPGHLALLKFARSLGDHLVVGMNSDRSVRELKGPTRPIHEEGARKLMLESLRYVDQVVVFDELRPTRIVRELMPQVIVKGGDYTPDQVRIVDEVPEGVEIAIFPVVTDEANEKLSTTAIITKLST